MDVWTGLPWWVRYPIALLLIGLGSAPYFLGPDWAKLRCDSLYLCGMVLLLIGPSEGQKKGYRF